MVGLGGLMVCRVKFIKLSRVLVPTIRRLPDEIRWTVVLLVIPIDGDHPGAESARPWSCSARSTSCSACWTTAGRAPPPAKISEEAAH